MHIHTYIYYIYIHGRKIVRAADLSFLSQSLNVNSDKEMKYAASVVGTVFLIWLKSTEAFTDAGECSGLISGCGQDVRNTMDSECCTCREATHESIVITLIVYCPLQTALEGNPPPLCCPCFINMTDWLSFTSPNYASSDSSDPTSTVELPSCVNRKIFSNLVRLFKKNDELVSILNSGCNEKSATGIQKRLDRIINRISPLLERVRIACGF